MEEPSFPALSGIDMSGALIRRGLYPEKARFRIKLSAPGLLLQATALLPLLPRHADSMENLARYIIRASFAQDRMTYLPREAQVIYESRDAKRTKNLTALGSTPRGRVPAEYGSKTPAWRHRVHASAIWLLQEFPVQRKRMFFFWAIFINCPPSPNTHQRFKARR